MDSSLILLWLFSVGRKISVSFERRLRLIASTSDCLATMVVDISSELESKLEDSWATLVGSGIMETLLLRPLLAGCLTSEAGEVDGALD